MFFIKYRFTEFKEEKCATSNVLEGHELKEGKKENDHLHIHTTYLRRKKSSHIFNRLPPDTLHRVCVGARRINGPNELPGNPPSLQKNPSMDDHKRNSVFIEFHTAPIALMKYGKLSSKKLKEIYGNDVVNEKTCRRWFSAGDIKKDDFSLKDEPRAGCSKNSILSNCKLPLMKIQPAQLEN
ncbi:hypothetical protein ACTXT7_002381 [Hymenolepis weldensis]